MPSKARTTFDLNANDVQRLIKIHAEIGGEAPGKRHGLEVLNKSAIVLISAIWEAYCEDIALEAAKHLAQHLRDVSNLPLEVRKRLAAELKKEDNELAVLRVSGDGWRREVESRVERLVSGRSGLNTPKTKQINDLFDSTIGLKEMSQSWRWKKMTAARAATKLDGYVALRGAIAHRGAAATTVKKSDVIGFFNHVKRIVSKTGGQINLHVKAVTHKALW